MFGAQYPGQVPGYPPQTFQNPYLERLNAMTQPQMGQPQHYEIIQVNGENGARAFRMAPNSQCLLLDSNAPIVWLAQTDGAGYPSLTPYTITPYQAQQPQNSLEERLERLEALVYGKPDPANAQQTAQPPAGGPAAAEQSPGYAPAASAVPAVPGGA